MKDETFTELLGSAREALAHAQGKRSLRTTALPLPPKPLNARAVKRLRATVSTPAATRRSGSLAATPMVLVPRSSPIRDPRTGKWGASSATGMMAAVMTVPSTAAGRRPNMIPMR